MQGGEEKDEQTTAFFLCPPSPLSSVAFILPWWCGCCCAQDWHVVRAERNAGLMLNGIAVTNLVLTLFHLPTCMRMHMRMRYGNDSRGGSHITLSHPQSDKPPPAVPTELTSARPTMRFYEFFAASSLFCPWWVIYRSSVGDRLRE